MELAEILETLARGRNLTDAQAGFAFGRLFDGELGEGPAGALLMGLRAKGETPVELAAAVREGLTRARPIPGLEGRRIDTCGTGGDNQSSFNCSTTVALVLATLGHKVVKHGNRSVSSKCGSADVVEALGLPFSLEPGDVAGQLASRNFVFLFAPGFHPAFKHVAPLRKALGIRTLFNLMGPLLNPARPSHQVLGVPSPAMVDVVAGALALTGVETAAVICGTDGQGGFFDELTPFGPAQVRYVRSGKVEAATVDPAELGLAADDPGALQAVRVAGPQESVAAVRKLLAGNGQPVMEKMVAINLAMALHLLEDLPLRAAAEKAMDALRSGNAAKLVQA